MYTSEPPSPPFNVLCGFYSAKACCLNIVEYWPKIENDKDKTNDGSIDITQSRAKQVRQPGTNLIKKFTVHLIFFVS
jgi:hypothetical protein